MRKVVAEGQRELRLKVRECMLRVEKKEDSSPGGPTSGTLSHKPESVMILCLQMASNTKCDKKVYIEDRWSS